MWHGSIPTELAKPTPLGGAVSHMLDTNGLQGWMDGLGTFNSLYLTQVSQTLMVITLY